MPLAVSTDLVVITSAESAESGGWSDVGGGAGSAQETDFAVQGSQCRSRAVSGAAASRGMVYDNGADLNFAAGQTHEDKLIYFWISTFSPGLIDDLATAPGLRIRIDTSVTHDTDYFEWDIQYSDLLDQEGTAFFKVYVLDPRAPATRVGGTPSLTTLRHFGAVLDTNAGAKGQNLAIDRISYGFGEIIVDGTATDAASGLQEMIDFDWGTMGNRYGVLTERGGIAYCKGKLVIGDDVGTDATAFTAQDNIIVWEDTLYYDGTRVRPTVGYNASGDWTGRKSDGTAYYGVDFRGNGTGDTDVTLGAAVGSETGRSGPTLIGSRQIPTELTGDDGAVEDVALYGTTFRDFRAFDFASNASTDIIRSCNFVACGSIDIGPVAARNNNVINAIGGAYTFLEYFANPEAAGAEQLSTADPITEWTDVLNGSNLSVPSATAGYVEVLDPGASDRREVTVLDDDKMGQDDHYAEAVIRFPSGGANQSLLGVVIRSELASEDYYYLQVDLLNDQITLISCNAGVDTTIDGPDAFTMDEDEDYLIHLRAVGTAIEAFISGNSAADGLHTAKLSATNSDHSGATHRRVGIRADAEADQTGDAPRLRLFGAGPVTDNLGALIFPATADLDYATGQFINCARAFGFDTTGTYAITALTLSGNLVGAQNDSGGAITGNVTGTVPPNVENLGASTSTFTGSVPLEINGVTEGAYCTMIGNGGAEDGNVLLEGYANTTGKVTGSFPGTTPQAVFVRARSSGTVHAVIEDDGGFFTDQTAFARDQTLVNDARLLPPVPVAADAHYAGGLALYGRLRYLISTAGATYVGVWEYWNGAWTTIPGMVDDTSSFQVAGWNDATFTPPNDWVTTTINGQGPFYYTRLRVTTGGGTGARATVVSLLDTVRYEAAFGPGTIVDTTGLVATPVWQENPNAP